MPSDNAHRQNNQIKKLIYTMKKVIEKVMHASNLPFAAAALQ
jgi:hypothetical protein